MRREYTKQKEKWIIPKTIIEHDNQSYFFVHGDEWGGNFLVAEKGRQVYVIDFEDAIYANCNEPETVIQVGGDLSSRIFSLNKDDTVTFLPIGLSLFASIGRLLAAIVQYHSRWLELTTDMIEKILRTYLDKFKHNLDPNNSGQSFALAKDYWDSDLKPLVFFTDWALYWRGKENSPFPKKHFDKFVEEIKRLLGCKEETTGPDFGDKDPPSPRKSVFDYPEDGNDEAKKLYDKAMEFDNEEDYNKALSTLLEAHSLVEEKGNQTEKAFLSLWIGMTADKGEEYSIRWFKQTEQALVNSGSKLSHRDENILLENYEQMIWSYNSVGDYSNAEEILQKWFGQYYVDSEDYSGELTLEWILTRPKDVITGDFDFQFNGIWARAAWLYFGKEEYPKAAKIFERLAKNDENETSADNWKMCEAIAYSKAGDYEKAELIELNCLISEKVN